MPSTNLDQPVIYFDGVCGLCNGVVDWVMKRDPKCVFLFSPLQGKYAGLKLPDSDGVDLSTIVLYKNGRHFKRSEAVLEILLELPQPWRLLAKIAQMVPRALRDLVYGAVAASRYRLFGKREICRIPSKEERRRFLD